MDWQLSRDGKQGSMDSSALYREIKSLMQIIIKKVSLKTHFAITKPKTLKSVQNLGSNLTNQQSLLRGSQLLATCVGFSTLLRSIFRILQCYWFI